MSEHEEKKIGLFDWLGSITHHGQDLMTDDERERTYDAFMIRRGLAMDRTTLAEAAIMNEVHFIDNYMQYQFLLNTVVKCKRFTKWAKKPPVPDEIIAVSKYFNVNHQVAAGYLKLLNPAQIEQIQTALKGGGAEKAEKR